MQHADHVSNIMLVHYSCMSKSWQCDSLRTVAVDACFSVMWNPIFISLNVVSAGAVGLVTKPFQSSTLWWRSESGKWEQLKSDHCVSSRSPYVLLPDRLHSRRTAPSKYVHHQLFKALFSEWMLMDFSYFIAESWVGWEDWLAPNEIAATRWQCLYPA